MKIIKRIFSFSGIILLFLSLWLAIFLHYGHFYEFMLVGLFFILYPLTSRFFNWRIFVKLYLIFFILGGIFGDFISGLVIGELWYYNYSHIFEYIFLYLLIYPFGGLVMTMSFLFFIRNFKLQKNKYPPIKYLKLFSALSLIVYAFFVSLKYLYGTIYSGFLAFGFSGFFMILYLNYLSEKKGKISYVRILLSNPWKIIFATLIGTYMNAILHEYPNLFVNQWVYQNIPFQNIPLFGVSIVVLIGWLALMVFPISVYYLIRDSNKDY